MLLLCKVGANFKTDGRACSCMGWGQTISQEHNCCFLLGDPNKYWNHSIISSVPSLGRKTVWFWNAVKCCEFWNFCVSYPSPSFHTWMCIFLYVNCWSQTVGVAGLDWVLKFKAVKEHQEAQVLEVTLQYWGTPEWHFSLRWNFLFVTPESGEIQKKYLLFLSPLHCVPWASWVLCGGVRQPFSHDHRVDSRLWGWKPCFPDSAACSYSEKCLCFISIFSGESRTLGNVFIEQEAWLLPLGEEGFYFPVHGKKLF